MSMYIAVGGSPVGMLLNPLPMHFTKYRAHSHCDGHVVHKTAFVISIAAITITDSCFVLEIVMFIMMHFLEREIALNTETDDLSERCIQILYVSD